MDNVEMMEAERDLGFEETELRLGLPGGADSGEAVKSTSAKRVFSETIGILHRPAATKDEKPPAPKQQVVGWPPVRSSFRRNIVSARSEKVRNEEKENSGNVGPTFVKVSMDGAPYLRKVDLKMYRSYQELSMSLEKMFSSFTIGNCGSQGMIGREFMSESKLMDLLNGTEYVPTYEDKDGDWMLVGDVPWEMFVESCKRLRIMKGSEAIGIAPRAVEKCKNRS